MIPFLNARLEQHGKRYIAGTDSLTIADLKVYQTFIAQFEIEGDSLPPEAKQSVREKVVMTQLGSYLLQLEEEMKPWLNARLQTDDPL